jgi:uncharacterized membrane protein
MDSLSLIMFSFVFVLGFITLILGFSELREIFRGKDKSMAAPAMGTVYFFFCFILWFVLAMYWPAMATDQALATLGTMWMGVAWISFVLAWACVGDIALKSAHKDEKSKLEIQEERRYEGY